MADQFKNPILAQALQKMRENQNHDTLLKASESLLNTKVLAPAVWSKEPTIENNQYRFDPDTKISLSVVSTADGKKYFPMFTSMEEVRAFYGTDAPNCLLLSLDQYLPFLVTAKGEIEGIVVDPKGVDVPFKTDFIQGIHDAYKHRLSQNTILKGQKVLMRNPVGDVKDLEAALISAGYHEPNIKAIYFKERLEDPENPDKTHWFIVVDADELDTGMFTRIGQACRKAVQGKEMEFMFTNQKLGADIAASTKPIYTRQ